MGALPRLSALLTLSIAVFLAASVPILDEESYLAITRQFDVLRPYNWWRPWPPWFGGTEPDAYVYAHPPLFMTWVAVVQEWADGVRPVRLLTSLPPAALLGWSAGRILQGVSRRPGLGLAIWLSSPIVILGIQRGLMPDLLLAALCTTSVMGWRERHDSVLAIVGGLALGLAAFTKYPALALVPVFVLHGLRTGGLKGTLPFWLAAAVPWLLGEAYLAAVYGRIHPIEVLTRASEISRGTGEGRALALLVRLSLGVTVLGFLLRGHLRVWLVALTLASSAVMWGWPEDVILSARLLVGGFALAGALLVVMVGRSLLRAWSAGGDELLMALWAASVLGSVWAVHNFAAPRYMMGAMLPLAILVLIGLGERHGARRLLWGGVGLQGLLALGLTVTEHRFFEAGADLARAAVLQFSPTHYTGEWSFRHEMDDARVTFYTGHAPSGSVIVAPVHSSPGELPSGLRELGRVTADEAFGPRVLNEALQIGLYAETLGVLPLGWSDQPVEEVVAWQVP